MVTISIDSKIIYAAVFYGNARYNSNAQVLVLEVAYLSTLYKYFLALNAQ